MGGFGLDFLTSSETTLEDFGSRDCSSESLSDEVQDDVLFRALTALLASWPFPDVTVAVAMLGP